VFFHELNIKGMIVGGAAAHQSFTREVADSHLVSPSRLQVARQSYILEVSHIHLCDWRRSLGHDG